MARALFVAGAGTEIGKTYVTAALVRRLRAEGGRVRALKPVASGVPPLGDPSFADSDTARLLAAQGLPVSPGNVAACSPWRFAAALAPDRAAAMEGRALALPDLVAWCRAEIAAAPDPLVVEGVGGLMSPVTESATGLDWLEALGLPVLLVSGSYLGAISHALTACETLRAHGVRLAGVAVSAGVGVPTEAEIVAAAIRRHLAGEAVPVVPVERDGACPAALAALLRGPVPEDAAPEGPCPDGPGPDGPGPDGPGPAALSTLRTGR